MKMEVIVTPEAMEELERQHQWLLERTPQHASTWYNSMIDAILSLEELADRCPVAEVSKDCDEEIRQLLCGTKRHAFRILFSIRGIKVVVAHVRHAAKSK